jgi:hypothetical protein
MPKTNTLNAPFFILALPNPEIMVTRAVGRELPGGARTFQRKTPSGGFMRKSFTTAVAITTILCATAALAADELVGTLTVHGKPTVLRHVAAAVQTDPDDPERSWLVILASDVPVAAADRAPARLAELAAAGKLKAVRMLWLEGYDTVYAVPYHQALAQSGRRGLENPSLSLDRYDEGRFAGTIKSKMMGQTWFFQAQVKAAVTRGGTAEIEPAAAEEEPLAAAAGGDEKTAKKIALARLGYEYTEEMFVHALHDSKVEAVRLFLELGMPANTGAPSSEQPLAIATTQCAYQHEAEALEMAKLLLAAGAKVDAGAKDGITPLLNAAQHCSGVEIVKLLIDAGANVNTKAPGGATPLMFANVFNRTETAAVLRKAGGKE